MPGHNHANAVYPAPGLVNAASRFTPVAPSSPTAPATG